MRPRTIVDYATGQVSRTKILERTPCGKQGYTSRKLAATKAKRSSKETGERIEAYRCERCHVWHIGHPPGYSVERYRRQVQAS